MRMGCACLQLNQKYHALDVGSMAIFSTLRMWVRWCFVKSDLTAVRYLKQRVVVVVVVVVVVMVGGGGGSRGGGWWWLVVVVAAV
jgi:hypothetical protein